MNALKGYALSLLSSYGLRIKKYWGQNFLVDEKIIEKIIQAASLSAKDTVIEIGAGVGILTARLASGAKKVIAIEIDKGFCKILRQTLLAAGKYPNITLIEKDILHCSLDQFASCPLKIIANLPYYITTPIIMHLLKQKLPPSTLSILMLQKEVGERIVASPGTKDYGTLSILLQYYTKPELFCAVSRHSFFPPPEVDSVILKIKTLEKPSVSVKNEKLFFDLVRAGFSQRRKILLNALFTYADREFFPDQQRTKQRIEKIMQAAGIDPGRRAETLSLKEFACLANTWQRKEK